MIQDTLKEILAATGRPLARSDRVAFTGADPVIPSPFRVGELGAAALAAVGIAAADLWEMRTGRRQAVAVDLRAATASLRGSTYLRLDGKPLETWDPMSGHYRCGDGRFVFLHCNAEHHRRGAMAVLGVSGDADRATADAAALQWEAQALEDAIAAKGLVGGMLRTAEEWSAHPQGRAVAGLPLLEIERIGEAPALSLSGQRRPLSGVRVLDLTRVLAGPTGGRTMAELGAEVLHVMASHLPFATPLVLDTGHGKRSTFLDLRRAADAEAFTALLAGADVMVQGYRPNGLAELGFSAEAAARIRPGIVYVTLTAYGRAGPWAGRRGFDSIVQNVSGLTAAQSSLEAPKNVPLQMLDYITGYLIAFGAMRALARRAQEGGSWHVRVSLAQTAYALARLGQLPRSAWAGVPAELSEAELARLMSESDTAYGRLRHLKPVLQLSETPPRHASPPPRLGADAAAWL